MLFVHFNKTKILIVVLILGVLLGLSLLISSLIYFPTQNNTTKAFRWSKSEIISLLYLHKGKKLLAAGSNGKIHVINSINLQCEISFPTVQGISALSISTDEKLLATVSRGNEVAIWDLPNARKRNVLTDQGAAVRVISFLPVANSLAGIVGNRLVVWNTSTGQVVSRGEQFENYMTVMHCSNDRQHLILGDGLGMMYFVDLRTLRTVYKVHAHEAPIYAVGSSPDGSLLASGGADGCIKVWSTSSKARIAVLVGHDGPVRTLAFSLAGDKLVTGGSTGKSYARRGVLSLWNATNWRLKKKSFVRSGISCMAVSPKTTGPTLGLEDGSIIFDFDFSRLDR